MFFRTSKKVTLRPKFLHIPNFSLVVYLLINIFYFFTFICLKLSLFHHSYYQSISFLLIYCYLFYIIYLYYYCYRNSYHHLFILTITLSLNFTLVGIVFKFLYFFCFWEIILFISLHFIFLGTLSLFYLSNFLLTRFF